MKPAHQRKLLFVLTFFALVLALASRSSQGAQAASSTLAPQAESEKPFVVEYYYKAKWVKQTNS